jgi:hypothetical protein
MTPAYRDLLARWRPAAARWTHVLPDGLAFYGTGGHEHWAVQAQATAFGALAVADADAALPLLRYLLATHTAGTRPCVNGQAWGHSWISGLALERCVHGVAALRPHLTAADGAALRAVLLSEADFLLDGYPVVAAIDAATGHNKPESNIWNGALLYRAAQCYPDAPRAARYRDKAAALLLNGISVPADADDPTPYHGRPVSAWHVGPNFTPGYGLHHHGYLNLGYMVICLSNIAMCHFNCRALGVPAPPELYHHAEALWRQVKALTFPDGRLWRIGGDTRVRYCYCQDYAVPMWALAHDLWGDPDAAAFAAGWRAQVAHEQAGNADGGFLTARLASLAGVSPLYYCRLEGDRAVTQAMGALWLPDGDAPATATPAAWRDDFHGAAMVRGRRLASWVWQAAERPAGTVAPADRSDLTEWGWNLAGLVRGAGCTARAEVLTAHVAPCNGGFLTSGTYRWVAGDNPAEGTGKEPVALARTIVAALPDDATVLVLQRAVTPAPVYLTEVAGLHLQVPNDLFNGGVRTYQFGDITHEIAGTADPVAETLTIGDRLGIEGRVHVQALFGGPLQLRRPGTRRVNLHHHVPLAFSGVGASLYCDTVCLPYAAGLAFHAAGDTLYDIGVAIGVDAVPQAAADGADVVALGADGARYRLVVDPGEVLPPGEVLCRTPDAALLRV